jgi:hypothetical protein
VKFPVPPGALDRVLGWMRGHLAADPHGSGDAGDTYDVQSLYLDTPGFDVFHRRGSYGRAKFRVRRYGTNPVLFLERKLKRDGVVRKRRVTVDPAEITRLSGGANGALWPGSWFHHRVELRRLQPVVMMNYRRVARLGQLSEGPVRVTLDRNLRAVRAEVFRVPEPIVSGDLFETGGVLEVKFATTLPVLVKSMVEEVGLTTGGMSKYRLGVRACGWVTEEAPEAAAGAGSETGR